MSVQLILYPQNYQGYDSNIFTTTNQFIVDGNDFNTVNASTDHTVTLSNGTQEAIDFYGSGLVVNTWKRFHKGSSGVSESGGLLAINPNTAQSQQGLLQKLSNLTVGLNYIITIDIQSIINSTNAFGIWIYSGTILQQVIPIPNTTGLVNITYNAFSTNDTIVIVGDSTINQLLQINYISISEAQPVPTGVIEILGDGQVICDLYEDEDLPLTLSVDDFKNVAEKVQSYSKAFNLPSTKRNNKIFNAIFEVTRSYDGLIFNPYKKTQCVLKQDGFILFEGFLRMLDVTDKEGEISYNVNLYSEVIALADTLKDRAFRDLDFTELQHEYNKTQIQLSWNDGTTGITYTNPSTSGFRDAYSTVKYPFVDWNHQILVGGSGSGTFATVGNPELPTLETAFRPFISIKYLIDRIFEASEFTYESAFFNTTDFEKLYMDFNWGADNAPVVIDMTQWLAAYTYNNGSGSAANYATNSFNVMNLSYNGIYTGITPPNYDDITNIITSTLINESYNISYNYTIQNTDTVDREVELRWLYNSVAINNTPPIGSSLVIIIPSGGSYDWGGTFYQVMGIPGDTLQAQFKTDAGTLLKVRQSQVPYNGAAVLFNVATDSITSNIILQTLRGELGQWDFLKGLITMFNLVTLVDEDNPNNILIEPYSDVFIPTATAGNTLANRGIEHDWTDKIDVSEMKLTPLTDLNRKTMFKFVEDDDDYSFNQYKNLVGGHLYGSKKYNAGNEFNILDGEDEIIAEPFAATVVKPLMSQFSQFITPAIYSMGEDGVSEGFENSPRIMYNNGIKPTGASYYIPAQNGVTSTNEANYLQFSHLTDTGLSASGARDFHFGECQLLTNQATTLKNLFNLYWLPYYNELYNPNTRIMTIKVNLSPADINTFRFNDRVFIKNRVFRVNKIDYKPNDLATVEFILIP